MRALLPGLTAAAALGAAAVAAPHLGLTHPWPLLLGALLLVVGGAPAGAGALLARAGAAGVGVLVGWVAYAVRMALLAPDLVATHALVLALAVVVVALAAAPLGTWALWSGLLGVAAYHGVYEPLLAADPAGFLTTSPAAVLSTALGLGVGAAVGALAGSVGTIRSAPTTAQPQAGAGATGGVDTQVPA